jgi:hypothetical protein
LIFNMQVSQRCIKFLSEYFRLLDYPDNNKYVCFDNSYKKLYAIVTLTMKKFLDLKRSIVNSKN